jgi:predicted nucleic acid-binding protein
MVIVDTTVWIDYLHGIANPEAAWLDHELSQQRLRLTDLTSEGNYRTLRALGHTLRKTVDCLIATFCLDAGHAPLHRDRDFDPFEKHLGLRIVHP